MKEYKAPPGEWDCKILLSAIPKDGESLRESFDLDLDGAILHWNQLYEATGPVASHVTATLTGDRILVRIEVDARFSLPCCRCLRETGLAITGDLRYLFTLRSLQDEPGHSASDSTEEDGDIDVIPVDRFQTELDLAPYVWEVLILNLPERVLCSNDCAGLCHICGHNKNEGDCGCREDEIDPRFAALRDLKE